MTKSKRKLNIKQELFCKLYVSEDRNFFGNWTSCYIEAYQIDTSKRNAHNVAAVGAYHLLRNPNITDKINSLLEEWWYNDQFVDKQTLFLITQHADFSAKMNAIREYNRIKQRVTKKIEHDVSDKVSEIMKDIGSSDRPSLVQK